MCIFYKVGPDEVSESCDYIWVVHWYEIGNYEGHGEAVSWDGKNYRLHSLSHCSCYGPEDGLASGDIFSLDDIFGDTIRLGFDIKPEIMEKLRELIQPIMADELQPTETGHNTPTKRFSMVVSVISSIKFKLDKNTHTVFYAERCKELERSDKSEMFGTFKAVVTNTPEDGIQKLAEQISEWLHPLYFYPRLADFEFQVQTSEVHNGEFWLIPGSPDCKTYNVQEVIDGSELNSK
jgi:hypothetical protein